MWGATLAILLLVAIIIRVLVVGRRAAQPFHTYVCVGIASMVMFQMIINIGMCLFIMPVIGLTLPFFQLRRLVGGDAVYGYGLRFRHQEADGGPPPSGTAFRFQRGILTETRGARRSGFFHRARSHIFPVLRQHYLCINTVYPN